jgi:hypothetical protein
MDNEESIYDEENVLNNNIGNIVIMVGYESQDEFAANHQWEIVNETTAKKTGPNGEEIRFPFYYHQIPGQVPAHSP